jgi:hypothetical protein
VDKVAQLSRSDRADLFNESAARMGLHPVIIEKDFWVCWILKQLFTIQEFSGRLVFKGGTSMSKCFGLIRRFSEDIDIVVDFEKLGFYDARDPRREELSHTKRAALLNEMLTACQNYIAGELLPILTMRVDGILSRKDWRIQISSSDGNIVEFEYPSSFDTGLDYIRPRVILEFGTHAEPVPNENYDIEPFAVTHFPKVFSQPKCSVATVVARRTFWEKATILHAEYHRPQKTAMPLRYSRHYVDVAQMSNTQVVGDALQDIDLLKRVTTHKDLFYHSNWAHYNIAKPGSFHLMPSEERLLALRKDYRDMSAMFFGDPPSFEDVLEWLSVLEKRINRV